MKVLVTGKNGQLGYELAQTLPKDINALFCDSKELDITNSQQVKKVVGEFSPEIIINAAAYTAVDKAENNEKQAFLVNETGVNYLAQAASNVNAKFIQVSTDFVFNGKSNTPYQTDDQVKPVSVYGASKLAGESLVKRTLPNQYAIIRTAWVYSCHGNNFVKTMLRLMREKEALNVVYDQVGTPTWANGLAEAIWRLIINKESIDGSIYHWTDAGVTSWYDFAVAIQSVAHKEGLIDKTIPITPISSVNYPTPATRPNYSVLDKTKLENRICLPTKHWHAQLKVMLSQLNLD